MSADTIYALSSGNPPAAIAVIRISGPSADAALRQIAGSLPHPRLASLRAIRHPETGELLDRGLVLRFPGPASATGEDLVELHLHGGRSVVAAVLAALHSLVGLRPAHPGEFTRRAFENGRIDLAEADGLADLLFAETQSQRRAALALAGGVFSRRVESWQSELLALAAAMEAVLDFSDEGEVADEFPSQLTERVGSLAEQIERALRYPSVERLRDGIRVVIAGPPNAGKSSLLNRLLGRRAAITSPVAGTTRDMIEAPVSIVGVPFLLIDTAGLRATDDLVEAEGVERTRDSLSAADLVLWLGDRADLPKSERAILIASKVDLCGTGARPQADLHVSSETGEGIDELIKLLLERAAGMLSNDGEVAINDRHRAALFECARHLRNAWSSRDALLISELLRSARVALDQITGRAGVEDMLDQLFGRFCIGK